jgi:copper chaperone CopZ
MKKIILTAMVFGFLSMPTMAKQITVDVNGLVCDFCAQSVKKVIGKQDGVTSVDVDLETKKVIINVDDNGVLSDEIITQLITDSGYDLVAINR